MKITYAPNIDTQTNLTQVGHFSHVNPESKASHSGETSHLGGISHLIKIRPKT